MWNLSCRDWVARLRDGRSLVPELPLDRVEADRAIAIYNRLKLPDVVDTPSLGEAGGQWFRDIVAALFGSLDGNGERQVVELLVLVPKKNSKTTNAAAVMLTALMLNRRPRADFLLIGPTQAIAEGCFNQAIGMIKADADLADRFRIQAQIKKITYLGPHGPAFLQIRTFSDDVLTGVKPIGVLVDELHVLGKVSSASRVLGQIRGGLVPFPEAFLMFITTQSDEPPAGVFLEQITQARAIRDGRMPARGILPVLYEFPEDIVRSDAWRNSALWHMVTPNLDRSIKLSRLERDWELAQEQGDKEIRRWASQHLNIQIGISLYSDRWAGAEFWEGCANSTLDLDELIKRSEVIVVGIDGGGLDDLLGLAAIGRERETRRWLIWNKAWAHASVLERRKTDVAPRLRDFQNDGDVVIVGPEDELGADIAQLVDVVEKVRDKLPEKFAIGLDPIGISQVVDELKLRGIDTSDEAQFIVGIGQGYKLNNAIGTLERRVAAGPQAVLHADQRLMDWCVGNVKVELKGHARSITKQAAGTAKIDPFVATLNATHLMALDPQAMESPYERRGFLVM